MKRTTRFGTNPRSELLIDNKSLVACTHKQHKKHHKIVDKIEADVVAGKITNKAEAVAKRDALIRKKG